MTKNNEYLSQFGFRFQRGGTHICRTMMLEDLSVLLTYIDNEKAGKDEYLKVIDDENCLGKRSGKTRTLTYQHLVNLYSLDNSTLLFRALLYFWNRDIKGQPLLALLCSYARDTVLRSSAPFILAFEEGTRVSREALEEFIDNQEPGRFSKATLKSTAQNVNSTWTKSGHLYGRSKKLRTRANPTAGSISYALLLGYISGVRGQALFQTEYIKLLDCSFDTALELAAESSRKGWIVLKRIGDVIEVLFPNLINDQEMEWLREQN
ncbi:hypothetical protein [Psychrobacter immobilis]|uniref:hypothetical protein n=1 Tax=Psychrobacter immobilis TaxID=498 RepID=UPI0019189DB0|nr:hypothetical protein [Psychrobacter immobilis]